MMYNIHTLMYMILALKVFKLYTKHLCVIDIHSSTEKKSCSHKKKNHVSLTITLLLFSKQNMCQTNIHFTAVQIIWLPTVHVGKINNDKH